jgi:SAM-dependent methyltransferase
VSQDQIRQSYASVADLYIELFGASERVHPDDLAFIARHLGRRPGPIFDLGCGPGHLTGYLRALGADASGIDLVPEFIGHARAVHPDGRYQLGSFEHLDVADHSVAGLLAWYSLIHLPPPDLDGVLTEFRRALSRSGLLVLGLFEGDELAAFDHKVTTAYRWPAGEMSARLARAGFTVIDRLHRPADTSNRPHLALAARRRPASRPRELLQPGVAAQQQ